MPATASPLTVNRRADAEEMAEAIFGDGVTIVGASYTGDRHSSGIYSGGFETSPGVFPGDSGVILSTGRVSSFTNPGTPNSSPYTSTNTRGPDNDPDFNEAVGTNTYDAAYLDIDFVPDTDTMSILFTFASEEYPEFASSFFTDTIVIWVNGVPVDLAVGDGDVSVSNISGESDSALYVDNADGVFNTEMDGFTATLNLKLAVNEGEINSIRIGIVDVNDSFYDSALLIAGDSVQTSFIALDDAVTVKVGQTEVVDALANDTSDASSVLTITHINSQPVVAGSSVAIATGQTITLNADGTLSVTADEDVETVQFSYTAEDDTGTVAGAFITVDTIPCFAQGTHIRTPMGPVRIEDLVPGQLVDTQDDGPQPVRWVGQRSVEATGEGAPIRIAAGTFGGHHTVMVSALHRILIRDSAAELMFGCGEVLVAARDLVDGSRVRRVEGGQITYHHLLFDRHQVVFAEGLAAESFLPGPQTTRAFAADVIDQIRAVFPDLDPLTGAGYGPAARRTLRRYEAEALFEKGKAA